MQNLIEQFSQTVLAAGEKKPLRIAGSGSKSFYGAACWAMCWM